MGIMGGVLGPKVRFIPARGEALGILIPTHQRPEGPIHCVISNACMNRGFAPLPFFSPEKHLANLFCPLPARRIRQISVFSSLPVLSSEAYRRVPPCLW